MAEDHRSGTDQIVDEFIAVLVDDPRAAAFPNEEIRFEIAEAAGRQHGAGAVCEVRHRHIFSHAWFPSFLIRHS